jgi:uncharacterized membrane-anchored protein YhcB (DUF1043 family)
MDWLIGLLLLAVGAVIGFFVAKYLADNQPNTSTQAASEQTVKELMNQQAATHVQETKQLVENLITQSNQLKQQVESYEELLISQQVGQDGSSLNYFGEHATAYLRNKSLSPVREKTNADIQPLDFSSKSSGLFTGSEEPSLKETK